MNNDTIPSALRRVLEQLTQAEAKEVAKWLELAPRALPIMQAVVGVKAMRGS
jgi:hypothetical protein